MKNLFLSAIAFIGFTVASYGANSVEKIDNNKNLLTEKSTEDFKDCKVTIKKKNPDGTWEEYQVTVHDTDCSKLIKDVLKK